MMFCLPIENIEIEDLYAESAWNFLRILSIDHSVRHVRVKNLRGGVMNNFLNIDSWKFPRGKGNIDDIEISGIQAFKVPMKQDSPAVNEAPLFLIQLRIRNFVIRDVERIPIDALCNAETLHIANDMANDIEFEESSKDKMPLETDSATHEVKMLKGGFNLLKINCQK